MGMTMEPGGNWKETAKLWIDLDVSAHSSHSSKITLSLRSDLLIMESVSVNRIPPNHLSLPHIGSINTHHHVKDKISHVLNATYSSSNVPVTTNGNRQTSSSQIAITCGQDSSTSTHHQKRLRNPYRPFECDHCLATFIEKPELKVHLRLYHSRQATDETYLCEKCGAVMDTYQSLMDHNESTHKRGPKKGSKRRTNAMHETRASQYVDRQMRSRKKKTLHHQHSDSNQRSMSIKTEDVGAHHTFGSASGSSSSSSATSVDDEHSVNSVDSEYDPSESPEEPEEEEGDADINQILRNLNRGSGCSTPPTQRRKHRMSPVGKDQKMKLQQQGFRPSRWRDQKMKELKHKCTFCQYASSSPSHLKYHVMIHTGEKPFHCNLCNKDFRQKSHLKVHLRVHH